MSLLLMVSNAKRIFRPQQLPENLFSLYWISVASIHRPWRWESYPCVKPSESSSAQGTGASTRGSRIPPWKCCSGHTPGVSTTPGILQHPLVKSSLSVCPKLFANSLAGSLLLLQLSSRESSHLSPCGRLMHVFLASHLLYSAEGEGALLGWVASPGLET